MAALVAAPLAFVAAPAQAVPSADLMISAVYPSGGNASALYNADYVELYNAGTAPASLGGKSLQYRAAASTGNGSAYALPDVSVPAGGYFLVQASAAGATGAALPKTPDANLGINLGGGGGQIFLAGTTAPLNAGSGATINYGPNAVIDFVGYGNAGTFETAVRTLTGTPANAQGYWRNTSPVKDNDNNATDFAVGPVTSYALHNCDCVAPDGLKITEVYTDGAQGAPGYDHDYVEIQNASTSPITLTGANLTLQYRAPGATGAATVVVALSGTIPASGYDVVELAGTDGQGADVPGVDFTNAGLDLSAAGGTLAIVKGATGRDLGTGAFARTQYVSDLVGWGSSNVFETTASDVAGLAPTTSLNRAPGGVDTDVNLDDLTVGAPTPNTAPVVPEVAIADIQGTGPVTPMNNAIVRTSGVVTAVYPAGTGQFAGFYMQTGGSNDPDRSDAIFVYMGSKTSPSLGASVQVTGKVTEFSEMTEITPATAGDVTVLGSALPAPVLGTVVPGTDCTITGSTTNCLSGTALAAEREKREGELLDLSGRPFTVSDGYDGTPWTQPSSRASQMAGEIGLAANSTEPLYLPIERHSPRTDASGHAARGVYNEAHRLTLDDGVNVNYASTTGSAFPWLRLDHTVRVGAAVTFAQPMIFDYRNDLWKLQPQTPVAAGQIGTAQGITIEQDRPAAPQPVGGNVKIATFNMLNYFVHPAQDWVSTGGETQGSARTCTYYTDRGTERLTANTCTWTDPRTDPPTTLSPGPRGAATAASLDRQEAKELAAINTMAADVMSLEEVENAIKLGYADRDAALKRLVNALNADWASRHPDDANPTARWAYVPTPRLEAQPTILEQDAIRSAFIYNPRVVTTVGRSEILVNSAPFRNAREPLAQAFRHVNGQRDDGFVVIVNHFKSKSGPTAPSVATGDNLDQGDGAGFYNGDRTRQAKALDAFAKSVSEDKGIPAVFLTGDFNAYAQEDPVLTLEDGGWTNLEPSNGEASYSFGGLSGSLDHVFANSAAAAMTNDQTIWPINANEPVYYEYSRYNYNVTNLYEASPYRASDHNPEIIGINAPTTTTPVADTVQILASNDFHGRLLDDPSSASAGAAAMAGAVKGLRAENPNTAFVMAGDIVGASTFESFIQNDKPTIDAMNEAGLEVSAAGNHEFDQGYDDLMDRIMSATAADGGASWPYIAANVRKGSATGDYALKSDRTDGNFAHSNGATWWKDFSGLNGGAGIRVGFVGAVTEDLGSLVAPSAIQGLAITSVVDEVNAAARTLKTTGCGGQPCDLVIELVHEGAPSPSCATIGTDTTSTFGRIVAGASADVDAIVSGHTHLKYNCKVAVAGKTFSDGSAYQRPVVSAGQYGSYLNQLEFEFVPGTKDLARIRQHVLAMKDYDEDAATKGIVDQAVVVANQKGAVELGQVAGPFKRARRIDTLTAGNPVVENRGGESTLGNLVAEIQRWKTGADIGVMNPGGLRDDLIGTGDGPGPVTYREAANVQPFANTLVTVDLTGAQLKLLLEQQWQRDPDGNIPSRPFLRLGTSKGFTWTEDSSRPEGDRITGMWLNGVAIDPTSTYTVSANSFLVTGGDNFRALTLGTHTQDTGFTDLQATVDYLADRAPSGPLAVDYAQHGVGARVTGGPFVAGDTVTVALDSLSMTGEGDVADTTVSVSRGATTLGSFPVTTTLPDTPYDVPGAATVSFILPSGLSGGTQWFSLTGASTGTTAKIPVNVVDNRADSTVTGTADDITWGDAGSVEVTVTPSTATGTVELYDGTTKIGEGTLTGAATTIAVPAEALAVGDHTLTLRYLGDDGAKPSSGTVEVSVVKVASTVAGTADDVTWGQAGSVEVTVTPSGATGTVELYDGTTKIGEGTLTGAATTIAVPAEALAVGDHTLTLRYLGDDVNASSTGSVDVTVVKAGTSLTASAAGITFGQAGSVAFAITPTEAAGSGAVEVWDGATKVAEAPASAGTVALPAGSLAVGDHTLTVKFLGNAGYTASETTTTVTVARATATVTATATPASVVQDSGTSSIAVAVTATGTTPVGVVTAWVDGTQLASGTLSNGQATLVVGPFATVDDKVVEVRYEGSTSVGSASTTTTVTVTAKPTPQPTATTVTGVATTIQWAKAGSVGVSVAPVTATGTVELYDGTTKLGEAALSSGSATVQVPAKALEVGSHVLVVKYVGSATHSASQGVVTVTITKAKPKVTVEKPKPVKAGQKAKIKVRVAGDGYEATGKVRIVLEKVGGKQQVVRLEPLEDGKAVAKVKVPAKGKWTVTVTYLGDDHTLRGSDDTKVRVKK